MRANHYLNDRVDRVRCCLSTQLVISVFHSRAQGPYLYHFKYDIHYRFIDLPVWGSDKWGSGPLEASCYRIETLWRAYHCESVTGHKMQLKSECAR